jgi:hypothetical protein
MFILLLFTKEDNIFFLLSSLLLWRTIGNAGQLNIAYYEFFNTNPYTFYTHIGPINFFANSYPYGDRELGQIIGQDFFLSEDLNANANFWASDGFASMGLFGVVIISILMLGILVWVNTISKFKNQLFILLLLIPLLGSLTNTSLFSTMWSGGGFFMFLVFSLIKLPVKNS